MENSINNNLLTIMEVSKFLKVSRSKAYSLAKEKDFPIIRIGKCIRVKREELINWLYEG